MGVRFWRHLLVIAGGLSASWGMLIALYIRFLRVPQRDGGDPPQLICEFGQIYDGASCTSPVWIPVILAVLGTALAAIGVVAFRVKPARLDDVLRVGAGTRFTLAFLASLAIGPLLIALAVLPNQGDPQLEEWVRWLGTAYGALPLFFAASAVGFVSFGAAYGIHIYHDGLRKKYLDLKHIEDEKRAAEVVPAEGPGSLPPAGFNWESL